MILIYRVGSGVDVGAYRSIYRWGGWGASVNGKGRCPSVGARCYSVRPSVGPSKKEYRGLLLVLVLVWLPSKKESRGGAPLLVLVLVDRGGVGSYCQ